MTIKTSVADYFEMAIRLSGKSQREISKAAGYSKPNIISMMKTGQTKIPVEKIPALAAAMGIERLRLSSGWHYRNTCRKRGM